MVILRFSRALLILSSRRAVFSLTCSSYMYLAKRKPALAGGDGGPVDDLHAVEGAGEGGRIGPHVAQEQHVGVGGLGGDAVLQELELRCRGSLVEAGPELGGGGLLDRGDVLGRHRPLVLQLGDVGQVALQHGHHLAHVGLLVGDGRGPWPRPPRPAGGGRLRYRSRSSARAMSMVLPEVTMAPRDAHRHHRLDVGDRLQRRRAAWRSRRWARGRRPRS